MGAGYSGSVLAPSLPMLVLAAAWAHVPHHSLYAVAPAPEVGAPGFALVHGHVPMLVRTLDDGHTYQPFAQALTGDGPTDLARLADGTLLAMGETGLWWSADGEAWTSWARPPEVEAIAAGASFVAAGASGFFTLELGGQPSLLAPGAFTHLWDAPAPVALAQDGAITWFDGAAVYSAATGELAVSAAYAEGATAWVGTVEGGLFAASGIDLVPCGELPDLHAAYPAVAQLAADDLGVLYAITETGQFYVSTDGCTTFSALVAPTVVDLEGAGAASAPGEAVAGLVVDGNLIYVATWNGPFQSDDGGLTWRTAETFAVDYARGVALTRDPALPVVAAAVQGSGPALSLDGGASWDSPALDLDAENVQDVALDPENPAWVYAVVNHRAYRSQDGGQRWALVDLGSEVQAFLAGSARGQVWAAAHDGLFHSTDAGRAWTAVPLPPGLEAFPVRLVLGDHDRGCFATRGGGAWCGTGSFADYTLALDTTDPTYLAHAGAFVVVSGTRAYTSADGEAWTSTTFLEADQASSLVATETGTLLAGTRGGLLYRSTDAGSTWAPVGERLPAPITHLVARAGYAEAPEVVVATLDGLFLGTDLDGPTPQLARTQAWQRVDDGSGYALRTGCPEAQSLAGARLGGATPVPQGCTVETTLRGSRILAWGVADGQSSLGLSVDGVELGPFTPTRTPEPALLVDVEVSAGTHVVTLAGLEGDGLWLDGLGAELPGPSLTELPSSPAPSPATEACACTTSPGAAHAALLVLGLVRRRPAPP